MRSWFSSSKKEPHLQEIDTLTSRLLTSVLIDDKLKSLEELLELSLEYPLEVGVNISQYIGLLEDPKNKNLANALVELLVQLVKEDGTEGEINTKIGKNKPGFVNADVIVSETKHISLLFTLFEDTDFNMRMSLIALFSRLLNYRPEKVQSAVLAFPMGVNTLVEMLTDRREVIRNDTLLLLEAITTNNLPISKIVVFEGAFDKLFAIAKEEGYTSGGIIVEDCLRLMENLLLENLSNQNFFRESGCVSKLASLLRPDNPSDDCMMITKLAINICHHLVSSISHKDQSKMASLQTQGKLGSILSCLLELAISDFIASPLRCQLFCMMADILHGHNKNQLLFASLGPAKAITKASLCTFEKSPGNYSIIAKKPLLHLLDYCFIHYYNYEYYQELSVTRKKEHLANVEPNNVVQGILHGYFCFLLEDKEKPKTDEPEKDYFQESLCAELVIRSFFHENREGQMLFASTFSAMDPKFLHDSTIPLPFGRVLLLACQKLLHQSSLSNQLAFWCSIRLLNYIFRGNSDVKEVLLHLPLEIPPNENAPPPPVLPDVLSHALLCLHPVKNVLLHASLLLLLCEWCYQNPSAIDMFFRKPPSTNPFFCHLIHCSSMSDCHLQVRGLCTFLLALCLDIHRDVFDFTSSSQTSILPPFLLFDIINNKIGIDRYKHNLDDVRLSQDFLSCPDLSISQNLLLSFASGKLKAFTEYFSAHNTLNVVSFDYLYDNRFATLFQQIHDSSDKQMLRLFSSAAQYAFSALSNGATNAIIPSDNVISNNFEINNLKNDIEVKNSQIESLEVQLRQLQSNHQIDVREQELLKQKLFDLETINEQLRVQIKENPSNSVLELDLVKLRNEISELRLSNNNLMIQIENKPIGEHIDSNIESQLRKDLHIKSEELAKLKISLKEMRKVMVEQARATATPAPSRSHSNVTSTLSIPDLGATVIPKCIISKDSRDFSVQTDPVENDIAKIIESVRYRDLSSRLESMKSDIDSLLLLVLEQENEKDLLMKQLMYYK